MIGTAMLFINNIVNLKPYIALGCRILQGGAQELDLVPKEGPKVVLLVIAHPDDESMFFVPSILAAAKTHHGKENHKPLHLQKDSVVFSFLTMGFLLAQSRCCASPMETTKERGRSERGS